MENYTENYAENNQNNQPAAVAVSDKPQADLFDKNARQTVTFVKEDEDSRYELQFAINGLRDDDLIEFDRLSFVKVESEGDDQIFTSDDLDACSWFFDQNIELVGGFDGELPDDWRDSFDDLLERQRIVGEFLGVFVKGTDNAKHKKSFSFGKSAAGKRIVIVANSSDGEIECVHHLPADKKKYLHKFIEITKGLISKKGKSGTYLPETYEKLGRLYDKMEITAENYANDGVPLHHKALVMREIFQTQAAAQRKK